MGTLGGLAFALFILAQIAAVVAAHAEGESRPTEPFKAARVDGPTSQIAESRS